METADHLIKIETGQLTSTISRDSVPTQRRASQGKRLVEAYAALLLFMFIYCARPEDWISGLAIVPLAKIAAILALVALAFSLQHIRDRMPRENHLLILLTAQLLAASVLSTVWRGGALQTTFDFAKVLMVVIVITVTVSTLRRLRLLIFTQAMSISAIAAVSILKGHLLVGRLEGILGGQYADPNDLALATVIALPLCLALLFISRNILWKILWSTSIIVMVYAVLLTGSRGGFLALIVAATVSLWEFGIRGRRRYLLALAVFAGVVLNLSAGGMIVGRIRGTFNVNEDTAAAYDSAQARQQLFWRSIELTVKHPIFGVGPGDFPEASGLWHVTHNSLTQMSSEAGLPALILYVLILWRGFKNLLATNRLALARPETRLLARALLASLAGYAVGSIFLSVAYAFFPYFLVAYSTALLSIERKFAAQSHKLESAQRPEEQKKLYMDPAESEMSILT